MTTLQRWKLRRKIRLALLASAEAELTAARKALAEARRKKVHPRGQLIDDVKAAAAKVAARRAQVAAAERVIARNTRPTKLSQQGAEFIASFEGFPNGGRPYDDPVHFSTVGYGHLIARRPVDDADRKAKWVSGQKTAGVLTQAEAVKLLRKDASRFEQAVVKLVKVPLTQGQFDALVSFAFNLGEGALADSTLLTRLNREEYAAVPGELMKWTRAGGKVLPGLVRRRRAEGDLFRGK